MNLQILFLLLVSYEGAIMKSVKYVKYNKTRREEFRLSTTIYEENGKYVVEKKSLNPKSDTHIYEFASNYEKLEPIYKSMILLKPDIMEKRVLFEYIEGNTIDELLKPYFTDMNELAANIKELLDKVFVFDPKYIVDFEVTQEFTRIFGRLDYIGSALSICNIDTVFDNIMISDHKYYCLDYEWVFHFPVPIQYIIYRSLFFFYNKYRPYLESIISQGDFINKFDINEELQSKFWNMENEFQQYVQGENRCYIYTTNYMKKMKPLQVLLNIENENSILWERTRNHEVELKLKDNHIENIEGINKIHEESIKELQRGINEQGKAINEFREIINEQNKAIHELKFTKDKYLMEINTLRSTIAELSSTLETNNLELNDTEHRIEELQKMNERLNKEIISSNKTIDDLNQYILKYENIIRKIKRAIKKRIN